jgi:polyprenyl-phospho-N-acetylgalactosaminyl synthase
MVHSNTGDTALDETESATGAAGATTPAPGSVGIVIAAYNEGAALGGVVEGLVARYPTVIVVDDGSRDDTAAIAKAAGAHVLRHPINLGQGAALQTGIDYALAVGCRYVVTFDADGQHSADEIAPMLGHLVASHSDIVLGSRFLGHTVNMPRSKALTLWLAVRFTRLSTGLKLTDTHNGFRALSEKAARTIRIRQDRMAHASEILDEIARHGLRYSEFPVTITYTSYSIAKGQRIMNSVHILKDQFVGKLAK